MRNEGPVVNARAPLLFSSPGVLCRNAHCFIPQPKAKRCIQICKCTHHQKIQEFLPINLLAVRGFSIYDYGIGIIIGKQKGV